MSAQSATLELVRAAKRGDDAAFEALLEPMLDPAYRLASAMLHDHHAAEDAVQESAFKAWRKLVQLRDPAQMRPWFLAIVANQCRSAMRSRRWSVTSDDMPVEPAGSPDEAAIAGLELRSAVRRMDPDRRLLLILHWYLDLPVAEIAAITKITVHAAESRIVRATNDLKSHLEAGRARP